MVRWLTLIAVALLALVFLAPAQGAWFGPRDATNVRLQVNSKGEALLTYKNNGALKRVLLWGAMNASRARFQVAYDGGARRYQTEYWDTFPSSCRRYDGHPLEYLLKACRAPDGSYWAVQNWPIPLPDLGYTPWLPELRAMRLEVSHWKGPLPRIEAGLDWTFEGAWQQIFVRLTYGRSPVSGRYIHLDTYNSVYGPGWKREDADPTSVRGLFCYELTPHDPTTAGYLHPLGDVGVRGPGIGEKYRITARGPGVTPDVVKIVSGLHPFEVSNEADSAFQRKQVALLASWGGKEDGRCARGWFPGS